ncbi:MAG TPA: DUF2530 domain-containing protein [Mycobacteriales bacterium]|nr:DUF2530 domain-containing protein [Mycobacteriales bacterium]
MQPIPEPVDTDGIVVVSVGTALWLVALIVLLVLHDRLNSAGHLWWIPTAAVGFGLGLAGIGYCLRRRSRLPSAVEVSLEP